jgi:hypothetical protein
MKEKRISKNTLFFRIVNIIDNARGTVVKVVNNAMVKAYWLIGQEIIASEQKGNSRAEYGKKVIEKLSQELSERYGAGWSTSHLWHVRQFYLLYKNRIFENLRTAGTASGDGNLHTLRAELSWSHYRILMRVENPETCAFYEMECVENNWSARELERQKGSLLFERLALSKDKKAIMKLAQKGQVFHTYEDMIKDPYVLEFTGLAAQPKLYENSLERNITA